VSGSCSAFGFCVLGAVDYYYDNGGADDDDYDAINGFPLLPVNAAGYFYCVVDDSALVETAEVVHALPEAAAVTTTLSLSPPPSPQQLPGVSQHLGGLPQVAGGEEVEEVEVLEVLEVPPAASLGQMQQVDSPAFNRFVDLSVMAVVGAGVVATLLLVVHVTRSRQQAAGRVFSGLHTPSFVSVAGVASGDGSGSSSGSSSSSSTSGDDGTTSSGMAVLPTSSLLAGSAADATSAEWGLI
jgi:hypothetical protein